MLFSWLNTHANNNTLTGAEKIRLSEILPPNTDNIRSIEFTQTPGNYNGHPTSDYSFKITADVFNFENQFFGDIHYDPSSQRHEITFAHHDNAMLLDSDFAAIHTSPTSFKIFLN